MATLDIVDVETRLAAIVRATVPLADMAKAQRAARALLERTVRTTGSGLYGPDLTIWRPPRSGMIDYAPGVFVACPLTPAGAVSLFEFPHGRAAHLRLIGGYDQLAAAWAELFDACRSRSLPLAALNWEVYVTPTQADLFSLLA